MLQIQSHDQRSTTSHSARSHSRPQHILTGIDRLAGIAIHHQPSILRQKANPALNLRAIHHKLKPTNSPMSNTKSSTHNCICNHSTCRRKYTITHTYNQRTSGLRHATTPHPHLCPPCTHKSSCPSCQHLNSSSEHLRAIAKCAGFVSDLEEAYTEVLEIKFRDGVGRCYFDGEGRYHADWDDGRVAKMRVV